MCIQFFRVSKYFDTRNYVHSRIMCSRPVPAVSPTMNSPHLSGQAQSPQQNIFFICAVAGEGFLTEQTVNLRNHALLSLRGAHNPGVNIISTKSNWTH